MGEASRNVKNVVKGSRVVFCHICGRRVTRSVLPYSVGVDFPVADGTHRLGWLDEAFDERTLAADNAVFVQHQCPFADKCPNRVIAQPDNGPVHSS